MASSALDCHAMRTGNKIGVVKGTLSHLPFRVEAPLVLYIRLAVASFTGLYTPAAFIACNTQKLGVEAWERG